MRRQADIKTLTCPLLPRERDVVDELKGILGLASDADLVRVALFNQARMSGVDVSLEVFAIRGGVGSGGLRRKRIA